MLTRPNRALILVVVLTLTALALSVCVPWLRELFGFAALEPARLVEAIGFALICVLVNDLTGLIWRRLSRRRHRNIA